MSDVSMRNFDVPSYDGDLEKTQGIPKGADELRRRLTGCDAFIVSSPEYNGAMPGAFKNLIDWTSRFRPQPFDTRHGLLLSASPSMVGGDRGFWALRMPLEHLGARIYPDMFSLAQARKAVTQEGQEGQRARQGQRRSTADQLAAETRKFIVFFLRHR